MERVLAAWFKIWSNAKTAKFQVINSIIGLVLFIAAPTPIAAKPNSVIGVSSTRLGPNSSNMP